MTIRRLMVVILVVSLLLALVRTLGVAALLPLSVALLLAGISWSLTWSLMRDQPHLAFVGFAASAVIANFSDAALCAYLLSIGGMALMCLVSLLTVPFVLGSGAAWAVSSTRHGSPQRRRPLAVWPLVVGLATAPMTMMYNYWPLRLAFLASRPALNRLVDRVEAGEALRTPEWAGLYRIVGSALDARTGNVGLIIDSDPSGRSGFVRLRSGRPPDHYGPFFIHNYDETMDGPWLYQNED